MCFVLDRSRLGMQIAMIAVVVLGLLDGSNSRFGWGQTVQLLDGIAAIVNDDMITISEVRETMGAEAEQLQQQHRGKMLRERLADLYQRALEQLIEVRLQLARARALNLQVDDDDVTRHIQMLQKRNEISDEQLNQMLKSRGLTMEAYRTQVREGLLIAKVVNAEVRSRLVVQDTELQAVYQEQREQYRVPGELTVSHILFLVASPDSETQARQKAAMVLRQLRNKGDFAALARKYSEGPSAERGGLLGTFRAGELLPEFEQAALTLKAGEISDIIQTRAGLHIIRVEAKQEGGYRSFDDVQEAIKTELLQSKTEQKYREWLETLRQSAYVKILYEGEGV
jgi:peptidyl-prolyl cis-trans isomerase SurA